MQESKPQVFTLLKFNMRVLKIQKGMKNTAASPLCLSPRTPGERLTEESWDRLFSVKEIK